MIVPADTATNAEVRIMKDRKGVWRVEEKKRDGKEGEEGWGEDGRKGMLDGIGEVREVRSSKFEVRRGRVGRVRQRNLMVT